MIYVIQIVLPNVALRHKIAAFIIKNNVDSLADDKNKYCITDLFFYLLLLIMITKINPKPITTYYNCRRQKQGLEPHPPFIYFAKCEDVEIHNSLIVPVVRIIVSFF